MILAYPTVLLIVGIANGNEVAALYSLVPGYLQGFIRVSVSEFRRKHYRIGFFFAVSGLDLRTNMRQVRLCSCTFSSTVESFYRIRYCSCTRILVAVSSPWYRVSFL